MIGTLRGRDAFDRGHFLNAFDAHILRARLEADGIFAVIHEQHLQVDWRVALAIGGAKVLVHSDDMSVVNGVLEGRRSGALAKALEAEVGDLDDLACPSCRSTKMKNSRSPADIVVALLGLAFLGIPVPVQANRHRCESCDTRWRDR